MTSYLVTIETDHHLTCLKMPARDKQALLKTSGVDVLLSTEKIEKPPKVDSKCLKAIWFVSLKIWTKIELHVHNISLLVDESSLNAMK